VSAVHLNCHGQNPVSLRFGGNDPRGKEVNQQQYERVASTAPPAMRQVRARAGDVGISHTGWRTAKAERFVEVFDL
jgi:hypothetical protein